LQSTARPQNLGGYLLEISHMGTKQDRLAERRGFQDIVPTDFDQTPPTKTRSAKA
jgi:hypothetical protein